MHPTSNDFAGQRCSIISNQFLTLIVIEIRFPSVPNIEICTQYLMSQIICSWEIKVRNQSLCKYWWKHIFIFKVLFLVYTTYIICIAWIHQPAIEIIIHMKTVFTFVVQEREDSLQMNVNFYSWPQPFDLWVYFSDLCYFTYKGFPRFTELISKLWKCCQSSSYWQTRQHENDL